RGGSLDGFRTSFAALGAAVALTLHGGFRANLFAGPGKVLRHRNLVYASFRSCRSFMQVLAAFATSLPVWSLTSHSTWPKVLPAFTTLASAVKVAFRTARRKLIFNSMVVNVSPSAKVAA